MTVSVCIGPGDGVRCPTAALTRKSRCVGCARIKDKARGTSGERGYPYSHQQQRAAWQTRLNNGEHVLCWRCLTKGAATRIDPTSWTLGHCDDDREKYHGPECPPCDYATAGRLACPHPDHAA